MAFLGAGSSSSGHIQQQEQADEYMGRATKRALERSAEDQEPDDHKAHAARFDFATSVPALSDVAVAQNQLPQDLPRALLDRGRVGRIKNLGIRSKPSRSPRPIAKNPIPLGDLQLARRKLFSELPPIQGGVPMAIADFPSVGVRPILGNTHTLPRPQRRMCFQ